MIDYAQKLQYLAWAEALLKQKFDPRAAVWLTSLSQSGTILGVVIFSRFTTGNCEITAASASPRFLTKGFLYACIGYAFGQMEMRRVTAFVAVDNRKSLSLALQLGFRPEGVMREWFPSSDAHALGLLRDDCLTKWLKDKHGQPLCTADT